MRLERHFISVQLPEVEFPVLFHEKTSAVAPHRQPVAATPRGAVSCDVASVNSGAGLHDAPIVLLIDHEQYRRAAMQ